MSSDSLRHDYSVQACLKRRLLAEKALNKKIGKYKAPFYMLKINRGGGQVSNPTMAPGIFESKPHVRLISLVYDIYVTLLLYDLLRNTPVSALLQHCFSTV